MYRYWFELKWQWGLDVSESSEKRRINKERIELSSIIITHTRSHTNTNTRLGGSHSWTTMICPLQALASTKCCVEGHVERQGRHWNARATIPKLNRETAEFLFRSHSRKDDNKCLIRSTPSMFATMFFGGAGWRYFLYYMVHMHLYNEKCALCNTWNSKRAACFSPMQHCEWNQ